VTARSRADVGRTPLACLILMIVALVAACDDHGLGDARARWNKRGLTTYRVTSIRSCVCDPDTLRPMQIEVVSGQIVGAVFADDQQPVDDSIRRFLWTVDKAFDVIQSALDDGADQLDVRFDPVLGYPTSMFIDYERRIADEELRLRLEDLTPTAL